MSNIEGFSDRAQQIIKEQRERVEALRKANETNLEYLRRTRPDMDDDTRIAYMFLSIVAGKKVKGQFGE